MIRLTLHVLKAWVLPCGASQNLNVLGWCPHTHDNTIHCMTSQPDDLSKWGGPLFKPQFQTTMLHRQLSMQFRLSSLMKKVFACCHPNTSKAFKQWGAPSSPNQVHDVENIHMFLKYTIHPKSLVFDVLVLYLRLWFRKMNGHRCSAGVSIW